MMDRYIEHEIIETCEKYGIGITPFSFSLYRLEFENRLQQYYFLTEMVYLPLLLHCL